MGLKKNVYQKRSEELERCRISTLQKRRINTPSLMGLFGEVTAYVYIPEKKIRARNEER
jgi:hypothetical protein